MKVSYLKHIFIINPIAGKKNAARGLIPFIEQYFKQNCGDYDIVETNYQGHARLIAESCAKSGKKIRLYACGGDGTLSEIVNSVVLYPNVEVGSIP